jgi:spermidine synthase
MGSRPVRAECRRLPPGQRAAAACVTLSESDGVRYLHFGSEWVQGAMRLARPFALELQYQAQMMAPLLLRPQPRHILQLGLGAGALTKFCWRHLAPARVTVVELSPQVVTVARRWFRLPADDARLSILIGDARAFLEPPRKLRPVDWLQVDLYDAAARGPVYDDPGFYAACRAVLRPEGILAVNLFGRAIKGSVHAITQAFDGWSCALPETDSGNRIVLAVASQRRPPDTAVLEQRAREVERRYRLPAREWLAGMESPLN